MSRLAAFAIALNTTFVVVLGEMAIIFGLVGEKRDMAICAVAGAISFCTLVLKIVEAR